jgi:hypothetical protein
VPAQALTLALVALLRVIIQQLADFNDKIAHLFKTLPDAPLFAKLPGAGPHLAPRLLVAFGEDRSRFASAQAFMSYIGIAPVKEESTPVCQVARGRSSFSTAITGGVWRRSFPICFCPSLYELYRDCSSQGGKWQEMLGSLASQS